MASRGTRKSEAELEELDLLDLIRTATGLQGRRQLRKLRNELEAREINRLREARANGTEYVLLDILDQKFLKP